MEIVKLVVYSVIVICGFCLMWYQIMRLIIAHFRHKKEMKNTVLELNYKESGFKLNEK